MTRAGEFDRDTWVRIAHTADTTVALHARPGLLQRQDREDLVNDVCLRVHAMSHRWDPQKGSLQAWVAGVARNVFREYLARRACRQGREARLPTGTGFVLRADITSVTGRVCRDEATRKLHAAIERLPKNMRKALAARLADRSVEDIADDLGLTPDYVRKDLLYRARLRLREFDTLRQLFPDWDTQNTWKTADNGKTGTATNS